MNKNDYDTIQHEDTQWMDNECICPRKNWGSLSNIYDDCPVHAEWFHTCSICDRDLRTHSHAAGCGAAIRPSARPDLVPTSDAYHFPETKAEAWSRLDAGYCPHGTYTGGCGIDWMCHECEMGTTDAECVDGAWFQAVRRAYDQLMVPRVLSDIMDEVPLSRSQKWGLVRALQFEANKPEVQKAHDQLIAKGLSPYLRIEEVLYR